MYLGSHSKHPYFLFKKQLHRIGVYKTITHDLKEGNCKQLDYKTILLEQGYLIYLCASWQGYIENLFTFYHDTLINDLDSERIKLTLELKRENLMKRFNTPNLQNINQLAKELFGVEKFFDKVSIKGIELSELKSNLDDLLKARHQVAHKAKCDDKYLNENSVIKNVEWIVKLAFALTKEIHTELGYE